MADLLSFVKKYKIVAAAIMNCYLVTLYWCKLFYMFLQMEDQCTYYVSVSWMSKASSRVSDMIASCVMYLSCLSFIYI